MLDITGCAVEETAGRIMKLLRDALPPPIQPQWSRHVTRSNPNFTFTPKGGPAAGRRRRIYMKKLNNSTTFEPPSITTTTARKASDFETGTVQYNARVLENSRITI